MNQVFAAAVAILLPMAAGAGTASDFSFPSIDGGKIDMAQYAGHPVLVANTASMCGFTPQYEGLQALYDTYKDRGLVVLAIPSDDFNQELATDAAVKEFCTLNYSITLPMTEITHVKGPDADPFYKWVQAESGFVPNWNFNKVLIGADGTVLGHWGSMPNPTGPQITKAVEAALGAS